MYQNPELKKNIWLDFSTHRLLLTPTIIILLVYLFKLSSGNHGAEFCAYYTAWIFIFIWGTKRASETVVEEINNSTWDFQRQSTITPMAMTWGKLIGSTLFSWYGAFIALGIYALFFGSEFNFYKIMMVVLSGLLGQAVALLLSLQNLPQVRRERNVPSFKYFVAGAIVGMIFSLYSSSPFNVPYTGLITITWYQWEIPAKQFYIGSLFIYLFWAILGLKRSFAKELQYTQIPWVWLSFNIFIIVYFSGLSMISMRILDYIQVTDVTTLKAQINQLPYLTAFMFAQLLMYIALFTDDLSLLRYQKLFVRYRQHQYEHALGLVPWWAISLSLVLFLMIINLLTQPDISNLVKDISPSVFIFTSTLFLVRDLCLIHYFNFSKDPKNALSTTIIYLALLYIVIPLILQALASKQLISIFIPSWKPYDFLGILSPIVQILFLGRACLKSMQKYVRQ